MAKSCLRESGAVALAGLGAPAQLNDERGSLRVHGMNMDSPNALQAEELFAEGQELARASATDVNLHLRLRLGSGLGLRRRVRRDNALTLHPLGGTVDGRHHLVQAGDRLQVLIAQRHERREHAVEDAKTRGLRGRTSSRNAALLQVGEALHERDVVLAEIIVPAPETIVGELTRRGLFETPAKTFVL